MVTSIYKDTRDRKDSYVEYIYSNAIFKGFLYIINTQTISACLAPFVKCLLSLAT